MRVVFLFLMCILAVLISCAATAADLVNIPMDHQISGAITSWGTLSFQPAGGVEPDGWARSSWPGAWRGPNVSFIQAGLAPVNTSDPRTVMEWDLRWYQGVPNNAALTLVMNDANDRWRNYGIIHRAGSVSNTTTWTHVTVFLNNVAVHGPYSDDAGFDPSRIRYFQIYTQDGRPAADVANDYIDAKKLVIRVLPPLPVLTGHVYDSVTHQPLRNAQIVLTATTGNSTTCVTDAAGYYKFTDPPTGDLQVAAYARGYVNQTVTKSIPAGLDATQDFNLVALNWTPLSAAKGLADGTSVIILGVVTASFPAVPAGNSQYYVEAYDRSCGIQIRYGLTAPTGAVVVSGVMHTDPSTHERYVAATDWSSDGPSPAIEPLLMNSRALGGGPCGLQQGVFGGWGVNNVGLLVKVTGRVTTSVDGDGYYYIVDGSSAAEGATRGIRVDMTGVLGPDRIHAAMDDNVVFTGICSTYVGTDGLLHPMIRPRRGRDCANLSVHRFKAIVVNCNPHCPGYGNRLTTEIFGWVDPHVRCQIYLDDLRNASGGFADYGIVDWYDCEYYTYDVNGFRFTPDDYVVAWQNRTAHGTYAGMDYPRFLTDKSYAHNNPKSLAERVAAGECDEILLFGAPDGDGRWEASMAGPSPFNVNGGTYYVPSTGKNVIIMGFNYERGVGEMLEDFCHRSESIMTRVYKSWNWSNPQTNWDLFTQIDKYRPGNSACGNCHYAPNSIGDYDWGNPAYVWSTCDDWLYNWPNLKGAVTKRWVDCAEWGNGDMRLHHVWWLTHFPKVDGVNPDGKQNNWWKYLCDYWNYPESR